MILTTHKKIDRQNKGQSEKRKEKHQPVLHSHPDPQFLKHPVFGFRMPFSKMDILCQSLQKQNLNIMQITHSTIYSTILSTILSDLPERPKVQILAWVAENKVTGEKTIQQFNSTTK